MSTAGLKQNGPKEEGYQQLEWEVTESVQGSIFHFLSIDKGLLCFKKNDTGRAIHKRPLFLFSYALDDEWKSPIQRMRSYRLEEIPAV